MNNDEKLTTTTITRRRLITGLLTLPLAGTLAARRSEAQSIAINIYRGRFTKIVISGTRPLYGGIEWRILRLIDGTWQPWADYGGIGAYLTTKDWQVLFLARSGNQIQVNVFVPNNATQAPLGYYTVYYVRDGYHFAGTVYQPVR